MHVERRVPISLLYHTKLNLIDSNVYLAILKKLCLFDMILLFGYANRKSMKIVVPSLPAEKSGGEE